MRPTFASLVLLFAVSAAAQGSIEDVVGPQMTHESITYIRTTFWEPIKAASEYAADAMWEVDCSDTLSRMVIANAMFVQIYDIIERESVDCDRWVGLCEALRAIRKGCKLAFKEHHEIILAGGFTSDVTDRYFQQIWDGFVLLKDGVRALRDLALAPEPEETPAVEH